MRQHFTSAIYEFVTATSQSFNC